MRMRTRFWIEAPLGCLTTLLFLITIVRRDWIEAVFGIDPDQGSGALEWLIVGALFVMAVTSVALAGTEWWRAQVTASWRRTEGVERSS
jgi:hypothetical protein